MPATLPMLDHLDVLLVDADPALEAVIEDVLGAALTGPIRLRCASSGRAGVDEYARRPADVVLLDLNLPDAQRSEPLTTLRTLMSHHPRPCVVVLTGHPWDLGRAALRLGAQNYLDKRSLDPAELGRAIVFAMERHAANARTAPSTNVSVETSPVRASRLRTPLVELTRCLEELQQRKLAGSDGLLVDQAIRRAYAMGGQLDQVVAGERRGTANREPIDLRGLAIDVADDLRELIEVAGAEVLVGDLPTVWGRMESMRALLRHLFSNSLQHGGPHLRIEVSAVRHERGVRVLVDDDGRGVPSERRGDLFRPDASSHGGFGLRACAAIAASHGARIWAEEAPQGGLRVVVEIPERRRPGHPPLH